MQTFLNFSFEDSTNLICLILFLYNSVSLKDGFVSVDLQKLEWFDSHSRHSKIGESDSWRGVSPPPCHGRGALKQGTVPPGSTGANLDGLKAEE